MFLLFILLHVLLRVRTSKHCFLMFWHFDIKPITSFSRFVKRLRHDFWISYVLIVIVVYADKLIQIITSCIYLIAAGPSKTINRVHEHPWSQLSIHVGWKQVSGRYGVSSVSTGDGRKPHESKVALFIRKQYWTRFSIVRLVGAWTWRGENAKYCLVRFTEDVPKLL